MSYFIYRCGAVFLALTFFSLEGLEFSLEQNSSEIFKENLLKIERTLENFSKENFFYVFNMPFEKLSVLKNQIEKKKEEVFFSFYPLQKGKVSFPFFQKIENEMVFSFFAFDVLPINEKEIQDAVLEEPLLWNLNEITRVNDFSFIETGSQRL